MPGSKDAGLAKWHEFKLTIDGANLKTYLSGEMVLEYVLGSDPPDGRNAAPPNPDLIPANNPVLRRRRGEGRLFRKHSF